MFFWSYILIVNLTAFLLFGIDKKRAQRGVYRIRESTLLTAVALGGSIGALAGMRCFRHKTRHGLFKFGIPAIIIIHILAYFLLLKTVI